MYEVCGRNESALSPLPDNLPTADSHKLDAYLVYEWLHHARHLISKGGSVRRNKELSPQVAKQSEQPCEARKGYTKSVNMLNRLLAIALEERLNQPFKHITTAP